MLAMHLSLKFWGVCFNLKTKTQHGIVFDGGGYKNGVLFSLAFVSQVSAVWFNGNADSAVTVTVWGKSTPPP